MSVEWGPATKAAAERQAKAIREVATEERHHRLADRAERGEFTDYADTHVCPITELYNICQRFGLHSIANRLASGEFDATFEESNEWAESESGKAAFASLTKDQKR